MIVNILLAVIAVLCFVMWCSNAKRKCPPLAEGGLPIVGHSITVLLAERERLYDIVLERILGSSMRKGMGAATIKCGVTDFYVLMNLEDGMVLSTSCLEKDDVYKFFTPLFGQGLLNAEVSLWKKHRKLLNPTFNPLILNDYMVEFNRKARELVKYMAIEVGREPFDPLPYVKQMSYQLILTTVIGSSCNEDNVRADAKNIGKYYEEFTGCIVERMRRFWYYSDFLFGLSSLKREQYQWSSNIKQITEEVIRKIKQNRKEQNLSTHKNPSKLRFRGFVDLLLDMSEEAVLTDEEIRDEVNTIILTGSDTIAQIVCLTLLILGTYPDVQKKVFEELLDVFDGTDRDVEKHDLAKLKYLDAVIKEIMRLYPLVVGFGRTVDKELKLKEYTIPPGSRCFVSIYHISRHPMWGADATEFRPERWLNPDQLPTNRNAFAVFGMGKRHCIGSNYAMMSAKTTLVHLLRQYRVCGDVTKLVRGLDIVVRMVSGHHITIDTRRS